MSQTWTRYYEVAGDDPRPTLLFALECFALEVRGEGSFAVDLGCGSGRDSAELLRRGWRVLAIDSDASGIERLVSPRRPRCGCRRTPGDPGRELRGRRMAEADLVNSSFALPFSPPDEFGSVWRRIVSSLRPGAQICGQLFGDRDEWASRPPALSGWASPPAMTFHTRGEVDELLRGLDVERLEEIDEEGTTAVGDAKHWHLLHVVARKR
jgi:tellurite methyltransferase